MIDRSVPAEVREFLFVHVHTYEQLETLILLQEHPDRSWTAENAGDALQLSAGAAAEALRELSDSQVLEQVATSPLSYRLSRDDVKRSVRSIADLYKDNRLWVMRLMNANAIERVRTGAMRAFADAFVIGGKKNG